MVVAESSATGGLIVIKSDLSSAPQDGTTPPDDDERMASQLELMGDFAELNATSDQIMNLDDVDKNSTAAKSSFSGTKDVSNKDSTVDDVVRIAEEHRTKQGPLVDTTSDEQVQLPNDRDLITEAEKHVQEERLLEGARTLRRVNDKSLLQDKHRRALRKARHVEAAVIDLTSSPDRGWTKQGESHGSYDTIIYYKVDENTRLTARIETPIDASLLVPLLSVFNESELYESCLPHFQGLGIHRSIKLRQMGRGNQIIAVNSNMPWPLANREAIIEATAVDDISTNNHIVVKMETRYTGEEDGLIPPPEEGVVRVDFDGGLLFRKCPRDHPAFAKSKHPHHKGPSVLVCLTMHVDPHVQYVPQSLINFVTRTALGRAWAALLEVAEGIRDGKRPRHAEAIAAKRNLYKWVEERVAVMIDGMGDTNEKTTIS